MKGCLYRQQQIILWTWNAHMETAMRKFTYTLRHAYATHTDLIRTHGNAALAMYRRFFSVSTEKAIKIFDAGGLKVMWEVPEKHIINFFGLSKGTSK